MVKIFIHDFFINVEFKVCSSRQTVLLCVLLYTCMLIMCRYMKKYIHERLPLKWLKESRCLTLLNLECVLVLNFHSCMPFSICHSHLSSSLSWAWLGSLPSFFVTKKLLNCGEWNFEVNAVASNWKLIFRDKRRLWLCQKTTA